MMVAPPTGTLRRHRRRLWQRGLALLAGLLAAAACGAQELPEYRLKAAFLYNFALFTEWPAAVGPALNVCVMGKDPFGAELDPLQGKRVGDRSIVIRRMPDMDGAHTCQVIFVAASALASLPRLVEETRGAAILTVADSPGAIDLGVALNLSVEQNKITFDANLAGPRGGGLKLSSKLLRLAHEVRQ